MSGSLFHSGIRPRLLAALVFAVLVYGGAGFLTRPSDPIPAPLPESVDAFAPATASPSFVRIEVESVHRVEEWLVRLGDNELTPIEVSPSTWSTEVTILPEDRLKLFSILTSAASRSDARNALNIRIFAGNSARKIMEQTHWCNTSDCVLEFPIREVQP